MKPKIFSFLSGFKESDIYYRLLNGSYTGNDSFLLNVGYFQITISLDHGITTENIKEIKKVLEMESFIL
jgi:hypothetical protein